MSDAIGLLSLSDGDHYVFLGRDFGDRTAVSDQLMQRVDAEIRRIIDEAYATAKEILTTHKQHLDNIAKVLLERETISGEELDRLIAGEQLEPLPAKTRPTPPGTPAPSAPGSPGAPDASLPSLTPEPTPQATG